MKLCLPQNRKEGGQNRMKLSLPQNRKEGVKTG
jgi:hypothetical protein